MFSEHIKNLYNMPKLDYVVAYVNLATVFLLIHKAKNRPKNSELP